MNHQTLKSIPDIDALALQNARIAQGISKEDLAKKLCLSVPHIEELESNKLKLFFSHDHRYRNALRLGLLLGLNEEAIIKRRANSPSAHDDKQDQTPQDAVNTVLSEPTSMPLAIPLSIPTTAPVLGPQADGFLQATKLRKAFAISGLLGTQRARWTSLPGLVGVLLLGVAFLDYENEALIAKENALAQEALALKKSSDIPSEGHFPEGGVSNVPLGQVPSTNPDVNIAPSTSTQIAQIATTQSVCTFSEPHTAQFTPSDPLKPDNFIYIVAPTPSALCVKDGQGKVTAFSLAANETKIVGGQAPFTVLSNNLADLQVYFQGRRVRDLMKTTNAVMLNPAPFITQ